MLSFFYEAFLTKSIGFKFLGVRFYADLDGFRFWIFLLQGARALVSARGDLIIAARLFQFNNCFVAVLCPLGLIALSQF